MKVALSIAGFDPSSGAGITADCLTFAAHAHFGMSVITALTVQSTLGVRSLHPVDPAILHSSLACLLEDQPLHGIKIGMLANAENVSVVANFLIAARTRESGIPVVLDPVLRSSSGRVLIDEQGIDLLRGRLLPLVDWVTPNAGELAVLLDRPPISSPDIISAAADLQRLGQDVHVIVTGGDLDEPNDLLLEPSGLATWLYGRHIESNSTHGTGCAFSSALLSHLMKGSPPQQAALAAKSYVTSAIQRAPSVGPGKGPLGLLWPLLQHTR